MVRKAVVRLIPASIVKPSSVYLLCQSTNHEMDLEFAIVQRDAAGHITHTVSDPVRIQPLPEGEPIPTFLRMDRMGDAPQRLFDSLWRMGYRPKENLEQGERDALKEHIQSLKGNLAVNDLRMDNTHEALMKALSILDK